VLSTVIVVLLVLWLLGVSRGLFAGMSLEGTSLRPDDDASKEVYGRSMTARKIVTGNRTGAQRVEAIDAVTTVLSRGGRRSAASC
jgi:lipid-binding SYLF domain-containing protein